MQAFNKIMTSQEEDATSRCKSQTLFKSKNCNTFMKNSIMASNIYHLPAIELPVVKVKKRFRDKRMSVTETETTPTRISLTKQAPTRIIVKRRTK